MADKVKVAILDDYQHVAFTFADWTPIKDRLLIDVFDDTLLDEGALAQRLEPYTIICAMRERTRFTATLLDRLPNLKLIATTGMLNRGIDVAHAKTKGIIVSGTSSKGDSTLEHIWALILSTVRYIAHDHTSVVAGNETKPRWQSFVPLGLFAHTLGLVGAGRLGAATAKIGKAFNMRVIAWSPHLTPERAQAAGVEYVETKEELFKQSNIVSVHMVLSDTTRGLINASDFEVMKPTAFFINTSRGPIVDEPALVNALKRRKIAGAGLDVYDIEPLPLDHPLRKLDNVTLTPHTGYVSDNTYQAFWSDTVDNIAAFLEGTPKRVLA
ncbi:hypothetical protein ACEPAF_3430 [Sanghuangporus sanghuang]